MTGHFDILYESLMGKIRQMTGLGGFNKLKKEWEKLKQEALEIVGARATAWRLVLTPSGSQMNYRAGGRSSLEFGPDKLRRLKEIKDRLDEIRKEVKALGIPWYKIDDTL